MLRCFVAIELDASLRTTLGALQVGLKRALGRSVKEARLQWVRPQSLHLTLKFLGDVEESKIPSLLAALSPIGSTVDPFRVELASLGVFPDRRAPRVLWIGVSPRERLQALARAVDTACAEVGFEPESRPFSPHLTVARIKEGYRDVGVAMAHTGLLEQSHEVGTLNVDAVALMQSQLQPSGSVYTRLGDIALIGGGTKEAQHPRV